MALQSQPWEQTLLLLASEARRSTSNNDKPIFASELLKSAYTYCDSVTAIHSRSFYLASALLPKPKRQAVRALYAFCRVSDDLVDCAEGDAVEPLARWRRRVLSADPPDDDLVAVAWTDARLRFDVPQKYAEQLIDGVARDLDHAQYATFSDLAAYCYGVASTVGLMSMHIVGFAGQEAIPYAIKLGVALQITNILRDIGEDWRAGRVYLPQADLRGFDLSEDVIAAGVAGDAYAFSPITTQWRSFMKFQIARNRKLYSEALPGIALLDPDGRFAIRAAAELYCAILDDIEAHDYNVFNRRAYIGSWGKVRMLPGIWWRSRGAR